MLKFTVHQGLAVPLYRSNVDTDQIIPKQFLTRIERSGYGSFLFNDWRFTSDGSKNDDFVLNDSRYAGASILISGPNFGCGSSREHAAWSLMDFGIRAVIAPSFGDIFYTNSLKNGLLPVRLDEQIVEHLVWRARNEPAFSMTINLIDRTVSASGEYISGFEIDEFRRHRLLNGLDDISLTLHHKDKIAAFERRYPSQLALS